MYADVPWIDDLGLRVRQVERKLVVAIGPVTISQLLGSDPIRESPLDCRVSAVRSTATGSGVAALGDHRANDLDGRRVMGRQMAEAQSLSFHMANGALLRPRFKGRRISSVRAYPCGVKGWESVAAKITAARTPVPAKAVKTLRINRPLL